LRGGHVSYININSLRYKFDAIKELLTENIVDLLSIAEAKLDWTFNDNLFVVDRYTVHEYNFTILTSKISQFQ
jgi:hypothetical protein